MKFTFKTVAMAALALPLTLAIAGFQGGPEGQSCCQGMTAMQSHEQMGHGSMKKVPQKAVAGQMMTVTVNNGGYSPSTINVKKGKPVHLMFKLGANPGCGDTVVLKDYKISKKLAKGKSRMVMFTPNKAGTINFTCGMGMYKGKIVVK